MAERFYTAGQAAKITGGRCYPEHLADAPISQMFCVDSRDVQSGDVFIAMRGARTDGHRFIGDAVARGAGALLVDGHYLAEHEAELAELSLPVIASAEGETSESAAVRMAQHWLEELSPSTVGITGSVGKTTTREILGHILGGCMNVHAAKKSYNTLIGCAVTVLAMPRETSVLILELGTNHPGEIAEMVEHFPVEHAVVTEISPAHLEGLGSIEGVCSAKMEIALSRCLKRFSYFEGSKMLKSAAAALPAWIECISVGSDDASVIISNAVQSIDSDARPELSLTITIGGSSVECSAPIFGVHNARNIALAFSVAHSLGARPEEIAARLATLQLPDGRCKIERADAGILIDDTYNANPDSMSQAIRSTMDIEMPAGWRRVALLGGMKELGADSAHWHDIVMSRASLFDEVHLVGSEWDAVETKAPSLAGRWRTADDLAHGIDLSAMKDSIVLVKGSRSYRMEILADLLRAGVRS